MSMIVAVLLAAAGLAAEAKPWHYWMAPGIAMVVVLATVLMGLGYVFRVVLARYGIRLGRR